MKKALKAAARRLLGSRDLLLLPRGDLWHAALAEHLRQVFGAYEIAHVLDVGANKGQFRDLLRDEVGFQGPIDSFEPVSAFAAALKIRAASDARWTIHPFALGSTAGEVTINVMNSPGLSSILSPDIGAMRSALPRPDASVASTETVRVQRLDDLPVASAESASGRRTFLKLDTQGFDLEVLRGASATLPSIVALQTELSMLPIYHGMPTHSEVLEFLKSSRFDVSGFFPVTHDLGLRAIEFDCVMINRTHAEQRIRARGR